MSFEVVDVSNVPQAPDASLLIVDAAMLADDAGQNFLDVPSSAGAEEAPILVDTLEPDQSMEQLLVSAPVGSTIGGSSEARTMEYDPTLLLAEGAAEEVETIVVVGKRHKDEGGSTSYNNGGFWYTYGGGGEGGGGGGGGTGTGEIPPPPDEAVIEVAVNFTPTAEQQAIIDRFKEAIAKGVQAVNALADDAKLTLENGSTVTGAELKAIVAKMDFIINPPATLYPNGTTLGAADYNNGNPQFSFNIDTLDGFDDPLLPGGLLHVVLHEVGHMVAASRSHLAAIHSDGFHSPDERDNHEEMANDIARAITSAAGLPTLANPGYGYSSSAPLTFQTGTGDGGDPYGGGGGGGGGGPGSHVSY